MARALAAPSLLSLLALTSAQQFSLTRNYSGDSFFDKFNFYEGVDVNSTGNVHFLSQADATTQKLVFTDPTTQHVFMKVDNTTVGNPADTQFGRNTVKLLSMDTLQKGDLMILDAVHMPFGCSVWTGFWTQGSNWPIDGEIDIIENVNKAPTNRMSLHTGNNCQHSDSDTFKETGSVTSTDCFNQTAGNEGCVITDPRTTSYGQGFNDNGGGAFAVLRDDDGIKMWFWPRGSLPADVDSGSQNPNPSGWGDTTSFFPASSCQTDFGSQTIYFHIDICGNFAGSPSVFGKTCDAPLKTVADCEALVRTPTNYDQAYFEIKSLTVFSSGGSTTSAGGSTTGTTTGSGSGSGSTSTSKTGSGPSSSTTGTTPSGGAVGRTDTAKLLSVVYALGFGALVACVFL